jgi:hypothetical protein
VRKSGTQTVCSGYWQTDGTTHHTFVSTAARRSWPIQFNNARKSQETQKKFGSRAKIPGLHAGHRGSAKLNVGMMFIDLQYLISGCGRKSVSLDLKVLDITNELMHPGSWNIWNRSGAKN